MAAHINLGYDWAAGSRLRFYQRASLTLAMLFRYLGTEPTWVSRIGHRDLSWLLLHLL
jgi:hypothetical protein